MNVRTRNEEETKALAKKIANHLEPKMTILLEGQLGAGKTTFTKGVAEALGIKRIIKSPTYTLIKEYTDGRLPLYHMDLYRMEDMEDEDLGLEEYFYGEGVTLVEWGSFMQEDLPDTFLKITISVNSETEERQIKLEAHGQDYEELLKKVEND